MRRVFLAPLALFVALTTLAAFAPIPADAPGDEPKVRALVFAADWCGACKTLDPKLRAVRSGFADSDVQFVTVDQTDRAARTAASEDAREGGYSAVYSAHEGKTGFVLLVDADSNEILDRITSSDTDARMRWKLRSAISRA